MTRGATFLFLRREVGDIRHNGQLLGVYAALPIIAIGMTVGFTAAVPAIVADAATRDDPVLRMVLRSAAGVPGLAGDPPEIALTRYLLRSLLALFLLVPVALSSTAAAFSIVGEKQQRTLEPVLATPITDAEFLLGKLLASLVPALVATWGAAAVAAVGVDAITWARYGRLVAPDAFWWLALLVLAPLLGAASVLATMRLSARSTDPQAAMQTSAMLLLPAFLVLLGAVGRVLVVSVGAVLAVASGLLLVAVILFRHNVRKFQREEILTRWR